MFDKVRSRPFILYLLFGGAAAGINLITGLAFYGAQTPSVPYWLAVTAGSCLGGIVNFTLNYLFTFRYRGRPALDQLQTFCFVAVVGTIATALFADIIRRLFNLIGSQPIEFYGGIQLSNAFSAHVMAVGIVTFYSYAAHRYLTFNIGVAGQLRRSFARGGESA